MSLLRLALSCLRVGAFVFGGGPVLIPLLEDDIVGRYGWLSEHEFTDAVALGQMTPGPLLVTATFVGWRLGTQHGGVWMGLLYAVIATISLDLIWKDIKSGKMPEKDMQDIAFTLFQFARMVGCSAEIADHKNRRDLLQLSVLGVISVFSCRLTVHQISNKMLSFHR